MRRISGLIAAVIVFGVLLSGCQSNKTIKVGVMTKLEAGSLIGSSEIDGLKLYLSNKGLKNVELIPIDDGWDPEIVKSAYLEARNQGIDIFITSHTSTCALELKKLTDEEQDDVIVIVTGSTTDQLSGIDDNNIRLVQDVRSEQKSIAGRISEGEYSKLLIIRDTDNNKYTDPALEYFTSFYTGEVQLIDFSIKSFNIERLGEQLKGITYDAVYTLIGGNQTVSGSIAQLAWHNKNDIKIFFTPWNNATTVIETAGDAIGSCVMSNHYPGIKKNEGVKRYFDEFKSMYGYTPTYNSLHVYRAMEVLDQAIKAGKIKPKDIKAYILEQKTFTTQFGPLTFNSTGDVELPLFFIDDIKGSF